jgi:PX domain
VTTKYNKYMLGKRFSDFYRLKLQLEEQNIKPACEFPKKTWFRSTDDCFLEHRRQSLDCFLKLVLPLTYGTTCVCLLEFFEYTKYNTIR